MEECSPQKYSGAEMKIYADTHDFKFVYDLVEENGNTYLSRKGKKLDVELVELDKGRYSLIKGNMPYVVNISKKDGFYQVRVVGDQFDVAVEDERTRKVKELINKAGGAVGEKTIKAPIPGLVVRADIKAGDQVDEGEALLILEAMKMENVIKAPFNCEVLEVKVKAGQTVNQGDVMIKIKGLED